MTANDRMVRDAFTAALRARNDERSAAHRDSTRVRTGRVIHSWAGNCSRRVAYDTRYRDAEIAAGQDEQALALARAEYGPDEDSLDETALFTFLLGDLIHEVVQNAMGSIDPSTSHEQDCSIKTGPLTTSGRLDTVIDLGDKVCVIELKSIGGFGFKSMTTGARMGEKPEGPKLPNLLQLGLNMLGTGEALGRPMRDIVGVLVYVSKETNQMMKTGQPIDKFVAEFHYTWDEIRHLVEPEYQRLTSIVAQVDAGQTTTVERSIPAYGPGQVVSIGAKGGAYSSVDGRMLTCWECRYCSYANRCQADGF